MLSEPDTSEQDSAATADASLPDGSDDDIVGGVLYVSGEESKEQVNPSASAHNAVFSCG